MPFTADPPASAASTKPSAALDSAVVGAVILAGGQGSRMGGVDKGLQLLHGKPLVEHALERLRAQSWPLGAIAINANRNLAHYAGFGVAVWPDSAEAQFAGHQFAGSQFIEPQFTGPQFTGPLAGFATALHQMPAALGYLLTVPCDCPLFPLDLLERLMQALERSDADIAMVSAPEVAIESALHTSTPRPQHTPQPVPQPLRAQPVFCLIKRTVELSLQAFLAQGKRRIDAWTQTQRWVDVPFDLPSDDPHAFANTNTLEELAALEMLANQSAHHPLPR